MTKENSFAELNLNKALLRALSDMGLNQPTPIQQKAYPVISSGRDCVCLSQTGTGKTLAYLLPVLKQLDYSEQKHPRVLILAPTRELVQQIVENIRLLCAYSSTRFTGVFGESNINNQKQALFKGIDVLVATPGRLIDHMLSRSVLLSSVKKLIVDEVDEMFNLGFRAQMTQILDALPNKKQNISFSATLSEESQTLIDNYFKDPVYVETVTRGTPADRIKQSVFVLPNLNTRLNVLKHLIEHRPDFQKVLVFVKNKDMAAELEKELLSFGEVVGVIHSNKSQANRFKSIELFEEGKHRLLVATDVVARGLDFKDLTHVVNFDFPLSPETYIHRIGRTGRASKSGKAISLMSEGQIALLLALEKFMDKNITREALPADVPVSDLLREEEMPKTRVKKLKTKSGTSGHGAFHEKKAKNKKLQLGGKRRQEKQRRALERSIKKRNR